VGWHPVGPPVPPVAVERLEVGRPSEFLGTEAMGHRACELGDVALLGRPDEDPLRAEALQLGCNGLAALRIELNPRHVAPLPRLSAAGWARCRLHRELLPQRQPRTGRLLQAGSLRSRTPSCCPSGSRRRARCSPRVHHARRLECARREDDRTGRTEASSRTSRIPQAVAVLVRACRRSTDTWKTHGRDRFARALA
jgi:hypothetical protein